ncbi:MAG: Uma2 family endonuclease [Cyanobacteria bacterium J06597_16]
MVASYSAKAIVQKPETRVLLEGVSWDTFERLLEETGENRHKQLAYSDGCLEIMVPLRDHEEPTRLFDAFVAAIVDELEIELCTLGSLTMKNPSERKGLEPDCCFYIKNESVIRNIDKLDFAVHPPPDLVVEVDNTSQSLDKFPIYVALQIPEIWRLRKGTLTLYWLNDAKNDYVEQTESLSFPGIPVEEIPEFIAKAKVNGQRTAVRGFRQRVAQMLAD